MKPSGVCVVVLLLLVTGLVVDGAAQVNFRQPQPGDVYKEFVRTISIGSDEWRVTDPTST